MEHQLTSNAAHAMPFSENFDCNKMKSLLADNSSQSFSEKFSKWIDQYTKATKEKIWMDIEYYRSK
jgi:hypothetical protein